MTAKDKEKLQKQTDELIDLELPIPREVMSFYNKHVKDSIGRGYVFADYITERGGRLFQRVFCFQVNGLYGHGASVRECGRRLEGGKIVVSNLIGGGFMQPYKPDTSCQEEGMHASGWVPKYCVVTSPSSITLASPWLCLNKDRWLKKYPYCAWEKYENSGSLCFFDYLCRYRKDNRIELLVKAGYPSFVSSVNRLNINGKSFEAVFKVKQPFAREYLRNGSVMDLQLLRKNEWIQTAEELEAYRKFLRDRKYYGSYSSLSEEEIRYVIRHKVSFSQYIDYLSAAKKLAYPLEQDRIHYPKDFSKAHDRATNEVKVVITKENDEQIKKNSSLCSTLSYADGGYVIFPAASTAQLLSESDALSHCVRTYVEKVVRRESLILFVRKADKPDVPFVTLELTKSQRHGQEQPLAKQFDRISQVRGYRNREPDEGTKAFVMGWKQKFHLSGWTA